jgi:retron-type reverse transcriptase
MSKINRELLRILNLPTIENIDDLAKLLHLDPARLNGIVYRYIFCYKRYSIKKKSGGSRYIEQPTAELKAIQAWILRNILDKLTSSKNATAYKKKLTLKNNVAPHESNRYFFCVDIQDFFPSIEFTKIDRVFRTIGYSPKVSYFLTCLCTGAKGRGLPQGGVTSPTLSNLTSAFMDLRLNGYCSRRNIIYTRYADDMTFSSNNPSGLIKATSTILRIIKSVGFTINQEKLKFLGPHNSCRVTGLVKNSSIPKFGIGVSKKKRMRAIMHSIARGICVDNYYKSAESIEGWLAHLQCVDKESHASMVNYWKKLQGKYSMR